MSKSSRQPGEEGAGHHAPVRRICAGGRQLVPDMETIGVLTGWRGSFLDLALTAALQVADHRSYLGGQGGAGAWVTLWKSQGLL